MKVRFGLRLKSIIATTILVVVVAATLSLFLINHEKKIMQADLKKRGGALAGNLAYNAEYGVLTANSIVLANLIQGVMRQPDVAYCIIEDLEGNVLASQSSEEKLINAPPLSRAVKKAREDNKPAGQFITINGGEYYHITSPITSRTIEAPKNEVGLFLGEEEWLQEGSKGKGGPAGQKVPREIVKRIGTVHLGLSLASSAVMAHKAERAATFITVVIVLASALITVFLSGIVMAPIKKLAEGTRRIASGDLDFKVTVHAGDEIGQLAEAFNKMTEDLKKTTVSKDKLEQMVEERTAELKRANEQLKQEISERKQAEEALASEKERLAVTLRSIGDAVITTDREGGIVLVNKAAEKLTGWVHQEAVGKPLEEVFSVIDEKTREKCENPIEKVIKTGLMVSIGRQPLLITKDKKERLISDSSAPIRDRESRIIGAVLVFRDITERRKMEEELLKAQKLESVGVLAGGIAHDFNNILTAIIANISIAKLNLKPQEETFKILTEAEKESMRAKGLTQQLLTFSRGGLPVKKTASVAELIKETAEFALRGSNSSFESFILSDLWPVEVDVGQISQVIHNLVINADQAMPQGGKVTLRGENILVTDEGDLPLEPGRYIKISVTDEGVGMPRQYLDKIFDPYFTTKHKGSGLGLATVYSIIKKHEGHITVDSTLGEGTTFYVYLPASREPPPPQKEEEEEPARQKEPMRARILVMDDEGAIRKVVNQMLTRFGYEVETARDGKEAIDLYIKAKNENAPFNTLILDLTVPGGMGGKETIKKLREIDPKVKAIVSSGYSPVMAEFKQLGFKAVVVKPYRINELINTVQKVVEGKASGEKEGTS